MRCGFCRWRLVTAVWREEGWYWIYVCRRCRKPLRFTSTYGPESQMRAIRFNELRKTACQSPQSHAQYRGRA
jgi:hypothetical protein